MERGNGINISRATILWQNNFCQRNCCKCFSFVLIALRYISDQSTPRIFKDKDRVFCYHNIRNSRKTMFDDDESTNLVMYEISNLLILFYVSCVTLWAYICHEFIIIIYAFNRSLSLHFHYTLITFNYE